MIETFKLPEVLWRQRIHVHHHHHLHPLNKIGIIETSKAIVFKNKEWMDWDMITYTQTSSDQKIVYLYTNRKVNDISS
jgi:hypothetical protein